jgi:DmsE family decaheme c-type cytochrome
MGRFERPFDRLRAALSEVEGRTPGPWATLVGALCIWLGVVIAVSASASSQQGVPGASVKAVSADVNAPAPKPAAQSKVTGADYVGEEKCIECHEDEGKEYHATPHSRAKNARTPAAKNSCETCHGPGKAHVDADGEGNILNPAKMTPRKVGEICVTCHARSEHNNWAGSKHDSRNISCTTCHSVHEPKSVEAQLKKTSVTETCVQCHKREVAKVHRSSHMPVREGKLECTTCHNPHGSQNVKMLREGNSINEACATCHAEKRGPFVWEHAAGRENCVTCHDPHGSNNERMLVAKLPMLCQRCHVSSRHPATIYENTQLNVSKSNRAVGRSCVNCHAMIHGSNHPSGAVFFR